MDELASVLGLLAARFECRHADCFSFRAVRYPRAVRQHVAIAAIKVCEIAGQFVTHRKCVFERSQLALGEPQLCISNVKGAGHMKSSAACSATVSNNRMERATCWAVAILPSAGP